MKTDSWQPSQGLAKGQLWKLNNAYIQIVDLGKRLIYYKILRQKNQRGALTRMIRSDALMVYLRVRSATLVS
ncbi:MAG TPA: hypothetical protein VNT26_09385 [Candidatus Sulfotelmatobacter sp.]|nr:hypothetical protein [Candidatus Sulfotelmatobacter sp.]